MSNQKDNAPDEKIYLFDRPENVSRLLKGFYAICILLVVLDFVFHRHIGFDWEKIPAFYAIYGFVACVVLVVIAKRMRNVLMRDERYYGDTTSDEGVGDD